MWPFKRKDKQEASEEVPAEIQEYYESERKERGGMAWLLALATLAATVLLALGLFFGGRFVYRKFIQSPQNETAVQQQTAEDDSSEQEQAPEPEGTVQAPNGQTDSPTDPGQLPSGPSESQQPGAPNVAGNQTPTTPTTGAGGESLPRTGPDDNL